MEWEVRSFEFPFGKYKGQTLEDIYFDDPSYLDWCLENFGPEKEDIKLRIRELFIQMKKVRVYD